MGRHLNHSVHIELYGLPGSGKSTTAGILAERLRKQGYEVREPSAEIDGLDIFQRVLTKVFRAVAFYLMHPIILKATVRIAKKNGYTEWHSALPQIVNIAQKLYVYYKSVSLPRIYIWDEGMIQAAISLSVGGTISSEENVKWLSRLVLGKQVVIKIYLETTTNVVKERLASRIGAQSRIEKESDEARKKEMLSRFVKACKEIQHPDCQINANGMVPEAIASIMQRTIKRILWDEPKDCINNGN